MMEERDSDGETEMYDVNQDMVEDNLWSNDSHIDYEEA